MLAMKTLNEHIKKGEYQKVYLIYGEEEYLKNQNVTGGGGKPPLYITDERRCKSWHRLTIRLSVPSQS